MFSLFKTARLGKCFLSLFKAARLVAAKKRENAEAATQNQETSSNVDESQINQSQLDDEDTMDQSESVASGDATALGSTSKQSKKYEEEEEIIPPKGLLGLDQAILHSIDKCGEFSTQYFSTCIHAVEC